MAYSTQTDIEKLIPVEELSELTAEAGGVPDAEVVAEAIAKAEAEINAYCGGRYAVPFSPVPEVVRSLAVDMAIYHLFSRRDQMPEIRRQKYEDAIKFLRDVSRGLATLGEMEGGAARDSGIAEISSQTRLFDRGKLAGW